MALFTRNEDDKGRTLIITERLTIQDAERLKEFLMEEYQSNGDLMLDLSQVQTLDLACRQVLCAAHRTFRKAGKNLILSMQPSQWVLDAVADMSVDHLCCGQTLQEDCLWHKGVNNA